MKNNGYKVEIDESREICGCQNDEGVMFKLANGRAITRILLTHEAIEVMAVIAEKIKADKERD